MFVSFVLVTVKREFSMILHDDLYPVFRMCRKGPVGLRFRPVGLRFRPVGLRFRPVGLRFRRDRWVFVLHQRVFVLDRWVLGLRSSFLGLRFRHIPSLPQNSTIQQVSVSILIKSVRFHKVKISSFNVVLLVFT